MVAFRPTIYGPGLNFKAGVMTLYTGTGTQFQELIQNLRFMGIQRKEAVLLSLIMTKGQSQPKTDLILHTPSLPGSGGSEGRGYFSPPLVSTYSKYSINAQ